MVAACLSPTVARRRALVLEGGGMKAAFANGVLSAFEEAAFYPWDAAYGTSAGGALAAWYSAGQAVYAEETWRFARDARFLSYIRPLRGGPVLDHEALLDIVYVEEHPLDLEALASCRWPVVVTAADVESGTVVYRDLREGRALDWLKATGRLPFASGPPVPIEGRRYVDGGVLDPIPVARALADGAADVVVVLNKPPGLQYRDPWLIARMTARRYPVLRDGIVGHAERKAAALHLALHPPPGVRVHLIHPQADTGLHRLSRDQEGLERGIRLGREAGLAFLSGPGRRWRRRKRT
jgi:predicted patatin/cPLA2 family phospholipase